MSWHSIEETSHLPVATVDVYLRILGGKEEEEDGGGERLAMDLPHLEKTK